MKKCGMERLIAIVQLSVWLFLFSLLVSGCAPRTQTPPPPSAPEARRAPQRVWEGERAKVVVMEFGNRVRLRPSVKNQVSPAVFSKSMKKYLVTGLHQTEQFAVLNTSGATRVLKESDFTSIGQMKQKTLEQIGPFDGAEFLITGAVLAYRPSPESVSAGIRVDPFFGVPTTTGREPTTGSLAKLFESLPTAERDRIAIGLRLIDVVTGKTIDSTIVEGTPQEFGHRSGRFFEEQLLKTSGPLQTPMQKALRVCTLKAVDWIAETGLVYRRQVALRQLPASRVVEKTPAAKNPMTEKKSAKAQPPSSPSVKKPEPVERPVAEKPMRELPTIEKAVVENPVAEKPSVEKTTPKKDALHNEEWGQ